MENVEYTYTVGMTNEEIDDELRSHEVGVLALARDGDAYAVPISYHYDGESLCLRLTDDDHSKKMAFVDTTNEATFLLYGVEEHESWSIVATGKLRLLDEDDGTGFDDRAINELFDEVRIFDQAIDEVVVRVYELEIEELTGRRSPE